MKRARWALLILGLIAVPGCPSPRDSDQTKFVVTGSMQMAPILQDLAESYEKHNPDVRITVQPDNSERGLSEARQGLADLGMVARSLGPDEADLHVFAIGKGGFAFLVHKNNPVSALQRDQVVRLFTHVATNWQQVGGTEQPVMTVGKPETRAICRYLLDRFQIRAVQLRPDITVADCPQVVRAVAENPGAIGYVSVGLTEALIASGSPVRMLPWGGVPATLENVENGTYPLTYPLNLVSRDEPTGALLSFLDFARSAEAEPIVRKHHFVPVVE
jgi:phosphate transport system substrate-binding protein